jgi:uncharacterized protein (DUF697 family)
MTDDQKKLCHGIIHGAAASAAAVGGGLAQLPLSDSAILLPIQIAMVVALGKVFGVTLTDSGGKALVLGSMSGWFGRAASQILVGWIPGVGNAINATTAASLTEAIGWYVVAKFDKKQIS